MSLGDRELVELYHRNRGARTTMEASMYLVIRNYTTGIGVLGQHAKVEALIVERIIPQE